MNHPQLQANSKSDLNIFYWGGSGGFFFLHLLLLSQQYRCWFFESDPVEFEKWFAFFKKIVYKNQWHIRGHWKNTETHPNNSWTASMPSDRAKIYLNNNNVDQWLSLPGQRVLLKTDIRTQIRLSLQKQVFYFLGGDPAVSNRRRMRNALNRAQTIESQQYTNGMREVWEKADIIVDLRDLICDPKFTLWHKFGLEFNPDQQQHIAHWLSLHPAVVQKKCNFI